MGKKSRKLQVTSTNNGKDVTKTYNFANTESSNEELATFANKINSLTDNTIKNVTKVDRQNITDAVEEVKGVTFELNLDLFAQNPDLIKQGTG